MAFIFTKAQKIGICRAIQALHKKLRFDTRNLINFIKTKANFHTKLSQKRGFLNSLTFTPLVISRLLPHPENYAIMYIQIIFLVKKLALEF